MCRPEILNLETAVESRQLSRRTFHTYISGIMIMLMVMPTGTTAMSRNAVVKLGVATAEKPLFVPLKVTRNLLEKPHYLSVTLGEIRSSGRHPPIIRLFLNTQAMPAKMQPGSQEHLGSLTIFPWPRASKAPVTKAAYNLSRKLSVVPDALRKIPGSTDVELIIAVAVAPDQREDTDVSVDVLSIEITPTDGNPG